MAAGDLPWYVDLGLVALVMAGYWAIFFSKI